EPASRLSRLSSLEPGHALFEPRDPMEQLVDSSRFLGDELLETIELVFEGLEAAWRAHHTANIGELHAFAACQSPHSRQPGDVLWPVASVSSPGLRQGQQARELFLVETQRGHRDARLSGHLRDRQPERLAPAHGTSLSAVSSPLSAGSAPETWLKPRSRKLLIR